MLRRHNHTLHDTIKMLLLLRLVHVLITFTQPPLLLYLEEYCILYVYSCMYAYGNHNLFPKWDGSHIYCSAWCLIWKKVGNTLGFTRNFPTTSKCVSFWKCVYTHWILYFTVFWFIILIDMQHNKNDLGLKVSVGRNGVAVIYIIDIVYRLDYVERNTTFSNFGKKIEIR